jgi:hypothetical protein
MVNPDFLLLPDYFLVILEQFLICGMNRSKSLHFTYVQATHPLSHLYIYYGNLCEHARILHCIVHVILDE